MKGSLILIAFLILLPLTGCQDNGAINQLQSEIDELRIQAEDNSTEMEALRSQAEEAQRQLEDANARIEELQAEIDEVSSADGEGSQAPVLPAAEPSGESIAQSNGGQASTSTPPAAPPAANGVVKVDLQGLGSGVTESSLNEADQECIRILEGSGTWGEGVTRLFPSMTQGGVEKAIAIYLEKQLFPGITTASGAEQIETRISVALPYMSEDAQAIVKSIFEEFS